MEQMLCPIYGLEGKKVKFKTVKSLVKKEVKKSDSYQICLNSKCEVVYFNNPESIYYTLSDLTVKVWFKDIFDENVPICYCSNLTRKEIKEAVVKGYMSITEIRNFTGKYITGNCLTENPTGRCCHRALNEEISKYSTKNHNSNCCS
jgi:bacterioferritin-associated ferredoxin